MRVALVCTALSVAKNFRIDLIRRLNESGYEVFVVARKDIEWQSDLFTFVDVYVSNKSVNPFSTLKYQRTLNRVLADIKPDKVFTFMLKPNVFGALAASKQKITEVYSMVEGLGRVYVSGSLKFKLVRIIVNYLYRKSFKHVKKVFFLNEEDKQVLLNKRLLPQDKCIVLDGIGINMDSYKKSEVPNCERVIMVSRLMHEKGVMEFCEAAAIVKKSRPQVEFCLFGAEDDITAQTLIPYTDNNVISYCGLSNQIPDELTKSYMLVLPSYREGKPRSVMEAMAVGRPVITTNSVGCKDTIIDGESGFLIPTKSPEALAEKILVLLNDRQLAQKMGDAAYERCKQKFDEAVINAQILKELSE